MKTRLPFLLFAGFTFVASLIAGPRDTQWQQVNEADRQGLPKTAIERLEPIITAALADKSHAEAIRAIGRKISLESSIEGNKAEERITRLQAELEKAPEAMKPMMEALLAHWYWHYFQQNRWRFMERTQTGASPGPDIQTWDLERILTEIGQHFSAALANEAVLQTTPIKDYDEVLENGNVPDSYRPTLFDFLSYEALEFYEAGEQGALAAEDEFEVAADGPIFANVAEFLTWKPASDDVGSPQLRAIRLYQSLLTFHKSDKERTAFLDADLARLTYGFNIAVGDDKNERYRAALQRFIDETAGHEISARAHAALASQLQAEGDLIGARATAERGLHAFPKSVGAAMCFNLILQIDAPAARLETESVWTAPWPTLDVTYRNVAKVYFRAVPLEFDAYLARTQWGLGHIDVNRERLLTAAPALEWDADLPATEDFKERTEKIPAPTGLAPGFYVILASHRASFDVADNQVSVASVWVSRLALVIRLRSDSATQSGFVLEAASGEPVEGAKVRLWQRDRDGSPRPLAPTTTDANGQFQFSGGNGAVIALAEHAGHAISNVREVYPSGQPTREKARSRTVFFTDRAIYRPGQTISYKGISIRHDQNGGSYSAVARRKVTVVFSDPNGKEIARATHRTNDYGSFSGVFTAPRDRLLGHMSIAVPDREGETTIRVEEYKRPKFQVELNAPAEAAKLGATVTLSGKATAYTGTAIGGAQVKWRVERAVRVPPWCWWWQPPAAKAIAHGTARTDPDGSFTIDFPADPDRTVPVKNEPVFVFNVHADVTDTTGETRSDERAVRSGYTALQATLNTDEWQTAEKPVEFAVATTSLDGDPQPASGTLTIQALKQPAAVERAPLQSQHYWRYFGLSEPEVDPTNPDSWQPGAVVSERSFETDTSGRTHVAAQLKTGIYRVSLETTDRFGKKVTARRTVQVVDPRERHYNVKLANHFTAPKWSVEPGEAFSALWGTGYERGRAFVELESNGKVSKSFWTAQDRTQTLIELPVTETMRGGFTLRVTSVHENRAYLNERVVNVPWTNKQLSVKWERFRSKLLPGEKETWTAVLKGPDGQRTAAEMVAALYDASLDQFLPHDWPHEFGVFRSERPRVRSEFQNLLLQFQSVGSWRSPRHRDTAWRYRAFLPEVIGYGLREQTIVLSPFAVADRGENQGYRSAATLAGSRQRTELKDMGVSASVVSQEFMRDAGASNDEQALPYAASAESGDAPKPDLSKVAARTNLNETAFFFPQLLTDGNGEVKMVFTMPEALTEWKFLGFAHDKQLRSGFLTDKVVTSKDLMVEPNPPRFVREGDVIEFTVKVSNRSEEPQSGTVRLTFADAASQASVDSALANRQTEQAFDVPANQSRTFSWRIAVPDALGFLTYKAVAATTSLSDGEEAFLPVLSRRTLVTESLPLPIRGKGTKRFEFEKLLESGASDTLRHQSLTVQMTSQPAWYAVMALPYLMEFPYECSEQVFNRFYANALARHIAKSDPKIRRIFDLWKATPALESPLEKNQELKSVMLEETPWLRRANNESQARRNVGLLFDDNRLDEETVGVLRKLGEQQLSEGLWPWFPGGRPSEYISLYIMTGFGRLKHLGVDVDLDPALKSLNALDAWMAERHREILKSPDPGNYIPHYVDALYLYGRSFFLEDRPIANEHRAAVDFYLQQSRKFWRQIDSRQSQAHLALALQRFGDKPAAQGIVASLKERSVSDEELGMFWRDTELSWWWYRAPIETQALMIEAFAEVSNDSQAVEDCKVWLLKQKQTQNWKTTKATADAIYGLLVRGKTLLSSDATVEVALAGDVIKPEKIEAGTGFYEKTFSGGETKPEMGHVTVKKVDDGVSWGSVHWQYLEDIAKITPHEGTPLKVKKTLWTKETTDRGPVLKPVTGALAVGDELVVRIELRTDRDMEYIHLKDQRGSGTEPVAVFSRYQYQDGLAYYESTRDTASHFFIDYLPKGVYVFEYSTRVQLRGEYQSGLAEVQCMYAPEFNSHSESVQLVVK